MLKQYVFAFVLVVAIAIAGTGSVNAQTSGNATQLEALLKQIAELQALLKTLQGEANDLIKAGLAEGMTDEAIKEVQQLLATDPEIYPSGLATGYFGPMTKEAIKRFQTKFGLEVTGTLNEETRQALSEVRKERRENRDGDLLKNPAVFDKIKNRLKEKWENCDYVRPGKEAFCKDKKDSDDDDMMDDDDMDEDDDSDDSSDDSDDRDVTRDDARRAVVDAQNELNRFRADIKDMEDDDADEDEIDDAKDMLKKAQAEMAKARKALARQEFDDAYESAEEVIEILEGNDDSMDDDDSDDSDEDEDEDEDDDDDDKEDDD